MAILTWRVAHSWHSSQGDQDGSQGLVWFHSFTSLQDSDWTSHGECEALKSLPPVPYTTPLTERDPTHPTCLDSLSTKMLPETHGQKTNHTESRESKDQRLSLSDMEYAHQPQASHTGAYRHGVAQVWRNMGSSTRPCGAPMSCPTCTPDAHSHWSL